MFEQLKSLEGKQVQHFSHNDMDGYVPQIVSKLSKVNTVRHKHCGYGNFDMDLAETLSFYESQPSLEAYGLLITDIAPSSESEVGRKNVTRLAKLAEAGLAIVLLDHHDTAKWISEQNPTWAFITSKLGETLTCGSELLYLYLKEKDLFEANVAASPYFANFIEQVRSYDTWDWDRTGNVFAKNLNSILYIVGITKFLDMQTTKLQTYMDDKSANVYTFNGVETILVEVETKKETKYIESRSKRLIQHTWTVEGKEYKVGVVFGDQYHSVLGNELNKENPSLDFVAILDLNAGKGSLRTIHDHVHVGNIAKAIAGGGGHAKAAGFEFNQETQLFKIEEALGLIKLDFWSQQLA